MSIINLELIKIKETELINEENEIKKTQNIISKDELSKKIQELVEERKTILAQIDQMGLDF